MRWPTSTSTPMARPSSKHHQILGFIRTPPALPDGHQPARTDKGQGGEFLVLPPGYAGDIPEGCFMVASPTLGELRCEVSSRRQHRAGGDTHPADQGISLAKADSAAAMGFTAESGRAIATVFRTISATLRPAFDAGPGGTRRALRSLERFQSEAIGIEKANHSAGRRRPRVVG
jgi:hypothetical protein